MLGYQAKQVWEQKLMESLNAPLFARTFIPKYKGNNRLLLWVCKKFKIGTYE